MKPEERTEWAAVLFVFLVVTPAAMAFGGFVAMKLWNWFLVPVLPLAALSWGEATGVAFALSWLTKGTKKPVDRGDGDWGWAIELVIWSVLAPTFMLTAGFLLHLAIH